MGKKILAAIELDDHSANCVLDKVDALRTTDDTVNVVYVLDPSTVAYTADATMTGVMYQQAYENAMQKARGRLEEVCASHDIAPSACHVRYGRVAHEVHELLLEEQYDQLMIGSHGWSGWRRVLGSKAASILHGVPVDTWTFKVAPKVDE